MANLMRDVTTLRDSSNIGKARLASSPYVLRTIFAGDPTILRLIEAGAQVIPMIAAELRGERSLDEISLAAIAYIVENVDARSAPKVLGPAFRKSMKAPGPFFVHFAAHAIRIGLQRPTKSPEPVYSLAELIETQNVLR